ncbi:hypothetical protein TheveDRAFT_1780 [Thermanaerovibrio velox DSM 12556]|uniref:AGC-kinase C-terminal domain-containing protein n=2 Tax=Thermanaerovibrio TaxID=81461 RepID=H0UR61_9BACT|nr:hypothetical protein TheveDRAFT_1780 [Thermanaerovibrio velox DSM 12556]
MDMDKDAGHVICSDRIRPIAEALVRKYPELGHVEVDKILFVLNRKSRGSKKRVVLARTTRMPAKWREILYQLGAVEYQYVMEFFEKTTSVLDENQMIALVYRELRRIGKNGDVAPPDVHEWYNVLMGLGRRWFYPDATCPNLLSDDVDWKKLMGSAYEPPLPPE